MDKRIDTHRTFIAIEFPSDTRARIGAHIQQLRREFPDVRASWSREENTHLTVKFLGNVPDARIDSVSKAAAQAASGMTPFELTISGCGSFPPHGRPKVLWVGIDTSDPLLRLQSALEDSYAEAGFAREARAYHPHLTIGRLRDSRDSRELAERHKDLGFRPEIVPISEVVVFRSELRAEGANHSPISRHELR